VARHRFGWAFLWSFGSFPLRLPDAKAQSKTRKRNAKRRRAAALHDSHPGTILAGRAAHHSPIFARSCDRNCSSCADTNRPRCFIPDSTS
jgi:hypothetical protein